MLVLIHVLFSLVFMVTVPIFAISIHQNLRQISLVLSLLSAVAMGASGIALVLVTNTPVLGVCARGVVLVAITVGVAYFAKRVVHA